ncbi:hypothetical protein AGLY_013347 [Aphis glycines]|uniref:Reverse transcriptase domain-containing protein n=1 Tax=Aphis glycines TaxID=307491 RepID=A0A6G0T860_APHGL|nr:hypothetical protein AGLY_013347 [Aphis glycines]
MSSSSIVGLHYCPLRPRDRVSSGEAATTLIWLRPKKDTRKWYAPHHQFLSENDSLLDFATSSWTTIFSASDRTFPDFLDSATLCLELASRKTGGILASTNDAMSDTVLLGYRANLRVSGKSPGPSGIPNEIIKASVVRHQRTVLQVFNDCLSALTFPPQWKIARLVLIRKGPEKPADQPSSFRPICMLDNSGVTRSEARPRWQFCAPNIVSQVAPSSVYKKFVFRPVSFLSRPD